MRIDSALSGVNRLYFDTAPLIYYVEENPDYVSRMDAIIKHLQQESKQGVCSVITLTEVLPVPLRLGRTSLVDSYRDILLHSAEFLCLPINQWVAETAAELRTHYSIRTPDALHIATAIHANCEAFLTNDLALKRVHDIRVLVLAEIESDIS